jgi:hypothetical protein
MSHGREILWCDEGVVWCPKATGWGLVLAIGTPDRTSMGLHIAMT